MDSLPSEPDTERQALYDSTDVRHLGSQVHRDVKQSGGCQGLGMVAGLGKSLFNEYKVSVYMMKRVLRIYSTLLNGTLQNS